MTGKSLSFLGDKRIVVQDQTDSSIIYIDIAAQPDIDNMELDEEQLELIAGGVTWSYAVGFLVAAGLCYIASKL